MTEPKSHSDIRKWVADMEAHLPEKQATWKTRQESLIRAIRQLLDDNEIMRSNVREYLIAMQKTEEQNHALRKRVKELETDNQHLAVELNRASK